MYLNGYNIYVNGTGEILSLKKMDFGGDKPWTNTIWNGEVSAITNINQNDYPIKIKDLDDKTVQEITIKTQEEFESWFKKIF